MLFLIVRSTKRLACVEVVLSKQIGQNGFRSLRNAPLCLKAALALGQMRKGRERRVSEEMEVGESFDQNKQARGD